MVPEDIEMSSGKGKFIINAEMIGKASKFINKNDFRLACTWIRVEKSELFGARIIATDGMRMIIFIDPQSDFKGPDFNLEIFKKSEKSGNNVLNSLIKECRKIKSNVQSKEGYIQFDPCNKEAVINDQRFKFNFNKFNYVKYKKVLSRVKNITNRKRLNALNPYFFETARHAILDEEKKGMSALNSLHFVNVITENDHTSNQGMFLLITGYSILITMPMFSRNYSIPTKKKLPSKSTLLEKVHSRSSLLEKVHAIMGHEPKNPLEAAVLKKRLASELEGNFGGIFSKFK